MVIAIEESKSLSANSIEELMGPLKAYEHRIKTQANCRLKKTTEIQVDVEDIVDEEPIYVGVAEALLKAIMTRKRNRMIFNSQIITLEVEAQEEEEEDVRNKHRRSNSSAAMARGMLV